jgi:hypothetical protein
MDFGVGYFPTHDGMRPGEFEFGIGSGWNRAGRFLPAQVLSVRPEPKALEQLERAGVQLVSTWLPSGPSSQVEPALEQWEKAIGELVGR